MPSRFGLVATLSPSLSFTLITPHGLPQLIMPPGLATVTLLLGIATFAFCSLLMLYSNM